MGGSLAHPSSLNNHGSCLFMVSSKTLWVSWQWVSWFVFHFHNWRRTSTFQCKDYHIIHTTWYCIYSVISAYIWIRFPWIHEDIKLISFKSSSWLTRNSPLKLRSSLVWIILTWFDSLMFMRTAKKWSYEIDWDRLTIFQVSPTCRNL